MTGDDGQTSSQVALPPLTKTIKWHLRRLHGRPFPLIVIAIVALAGGLAGVALFHSPVMGMLGFAMILAATAEYWLGSTYIVDAKGVRSRTGASLTSMEWKDVKRVVVEPQAIKLSPLPEAGSLDSFRGVLLRTNDAVRQPVMEHIRSCVPQDVRFDAAAQELSS